MAFYIKVTKQVADKMQLTDVRNSTADGNVLLWQADVAGVPGDTVFDRAAQVGGVCLTARQAKEEIDGADHPVQVTTPERFFGKPEAEPNPEPEAEPEAEAEPEPEPSTDQTEQEVSHE